MKEWLSCGFVRATQHKLGHHLPVPSQSLVVVRKKQNLTQWKPTTNNRNNVLDGVQILPREGAIVKCRDTTAICAKRLNRSRCRLVCRLGWVQRGAYWRNLVNTIDLSMCGGDWAFLSNYLDHLFVFEKDDAFVRWRDFDNLLILYYILRIF